MRRAIKLTGQGGSFINYLILQIGDSLKQFTDGGSKANSHNVEIIAAHVDAMRRVMIDNIKDDVGDMARAIVDGL